MMPGLKAGFTLDSRLEADSDQLMWLGLCELRVMNDRRWPWLLLVPQGPGAAEIPDMCAYQCMGRAVARVRAGGQLVHQVQARIAVVRQELLQPRIKLQNFGFKITHLRRIRHHQSQGRL